MCALDFCYECLRRYQDSECPHTWLGAGEEAQLAAQLMAGVEEAQWRREERRARYHRRLREAEMAERKSWVEVLREMGVAEEEVDDSEGLQARVWERMREEGVMTRDEVEAAEAAGWSD